MSLNISNLLSKLQKYYKSDNSTGNRYTGTDENVSSFVAEYGLAEEVHSFSLTDDQLSKTIVENGISLTVSAESATSFKYQITDGKIVIFGNKLTITLDESNSDLIEVVGISNQINATSKDDKITVYGYDNNIKGLNGNDSIDINGNDNIVDSGNGEDTVNVYGDLNTLINSEKNIFKGAGSQYIQFGENEFYASLNPSTKTSDSDEAELTVDYNNTTGKITFTGNDISLITNKDKADEIEINGNNNYLDVGTGADKVSVNGDNNIISTGIDEEEDSINIDGSNNKIIGSSEDKVYYTEDTGSVNIMAGDLSQHFVKITDSSGNIYEYKIENNGNDKNAEISYKINSDGEIVFTGSNAKITSLCSEDTENETIRLIGDNNFIDIGDGEDTVYIIGKNNKAAGGEDDKFYYTSTQGSVTISADDEAEHYIMVGGFSYLIQRKELSGDNADKDITVEYNLTENGLLEISGSNFRLEEFDTSKNDNLKITGNNNEIYTHDGDDTVEIVGNNNLVHTGEGDDTVIINGDNNEAQGDKGTDGIVVKGDDNIYEGFEVEDKIITLTYDDPAQLVDINGKKYTIKMTQSAIDEKKTVDILLQDREDGLKIEADDVIITANKGQADNIVFKGSNSKIFAGDKNDTITVEGDNNYIDGWSGNDKIKATGLSNKVYGFLGDDEIEIIQRENTESEIIAEALKIADEDKDGNEISDEQKLTQAIEKLETEGANYVDGEFGTNTLNASAHTKVSSNIQRFTSEAQTISLKPTEDEKKIIYDGRTYTIKNYVTLENNNPFLKDRTIKYEFVDVTVKDTDGNETTKKELIVSGDFISVVADDGQNDVVKIVGGSSYVDLGDKDDILEAEGDSNLLFGGIGADIINVKGNKNTVNGDFKGKISSNDNDDITIEGDENVISGGTGNNDKLHIIDGNNSVWSDVEFVEGSYQNRYTLTNTEREKVLTVGNGKSYKIKVNIPDDETLKAAIPFDYKYDEETGELTIKGDKLEITAVGSQTDNIIFHGHDCVINLGDGNDTIDASGANNVINGGLGNDTIKIFGESFKVYGQAGNDSVISNAINSTVDGGAGKNDLTISNRNGANNKIDGFSTINDKPSEGVVVLTPSRTKAELKLTLNGKEVTFVVQPNNIIYPQKLASNIYVRYEINTIDLKDKNGNVIGKTQQLVIEGDGVQVAPPVGTDPDTAIYAKIIGNNMKLVTSKGDDVIEVYGNNNTVDAVGGLVVEGGGQNTIYAEGNNNTISGGRDIDTFTVKGNENIIIGGGSGGDIVNFDGINNNFKTQADSEISKGSFYLTKDSEPQYVVLTVNGKKRAYRLSLYNIDKASLDSTLINVQYEVDSEGYTVFYANNVKIEVIDEHSTQYTDEVTTDNRDSIKLVGNNCYVKGAYGSDVLIIKGDNNIADGWYGDDSIQLIGNNNTARGFNGNDNIIIEGNENKAIGEQGTDTLTIVSGEDNTYESIENIK